MRDLASFLRYCLIAGLALVLPAGALAQDQRRFEVEGWLGVVYGDTYSGGFSHCSVYADYQNGITLIFTRSADRRWSMTVVNPDWAFAGAGPHLVELRVDRQPLRNAEALAIQPTHLVLPLADRDPLIDEIRRGRALSFAVGGNRFGFDLSGTLAALDALRDCVDTEIARGETLSPGLGSDGPPGTPAEARRQEARAFAARLITRLADPRIAWLSGEAIPRQFSGHEAVFRSAASIVSVRIIQDGRAASPAAVAEALARHDAALCAEEADIARPVDWAGAARHLTIRCAEPLWTTFYTVVPRSAGGHYLTSLHALEPLGSMSPRTAAIVRAEAADIAREIRDLGADQADMPDLRN